MAANNFTVDKKVARGTRGVPIEWHLPENNSQFARKADGSLAIYGCGCTGFTDEGRIVKGTYNQEVTGNVSKTFTLFFDDGKPLEVKNNKGIVIRNPDKKKALLSFNITI